MRLWTTTIIAGVVAGALASPAAAQQEVRIGVILSYSGQFADPAKQMDNAIQLYMKQNGDTVAGKKIVLIRKDTGGIAPDLAKRLAQELVVRDRVDILAGFALTPNALAVGDVSQQAKKFMVVMNAATSIITTKSAFMARTSVTTPMLNQTLGTWAAKQGIKKAYTMVSDFGPGHDGEGAFHAGFKAGGGEIVGAVRTPVANPDFAPFLQRAKDANPDGMYIWVPGGAQPAAVGKAIVERNIDKSKVTIMGQDELVGENAIKSMNEAAVGIVSVSNYDFNLNNDLNRKFVEAYNKEFGRNPDIFSMGAYDGMHLIYEALKKTNGNTDAAALIGAAKGMAWQSPRGPMSIDPDTRDVVQNIYIRRVQKVGDKFVNVEFDTIPAVKDPVKEQMKKEGKPLQP